MNARSPPSKGTVHVEELILRKLVARPCIPTIPLLKAHSLTLQEQSSEETNLLSHLSLGEQLEFRFFDELPRFQSLFDIEFWVFQQEGNATSSL